MSAHCVGPFDRSGFTHLTGLSGAWQAVMGGAVVNSGGQPGQALWSSIQTSGPSTNPSTISNADIDAAFVAVRNYNATSPTIPWRVKLRISAGSYQPGWLKALANTGSYGPLLTTGGSSPQTMLAEWTPSYRTAWADFMAALAAYVPADGLGFALGVHPNMGELSVGGSMTTYAEPMLITGWSYSQLGFSSKSAYAAAAQPYLQLILADTIAAWPGKPVALSYNPYCNTADTFTETTMAYQTSSVGGGGAGGVTPLGVLMNNSLRNNGASVVAPTYAPDPNTGLPWCTHGTYNDPLGPSASYTAMYTAQALLGQGAAAAALGGAGYPIAHPVPIAYQTAQLHLIGTATDLCNTLSYAIWLGARMVEMPSGFDTIGSTFTPAMLGNYYAGFVANDPVAVSSSPIVQHLTGGSGGDVTSLTVQNLPTTAGNLLVLIVHARAATTPVISIVGGGTWVNRINQNSVGLNANYTHWDLVPSSAVGANGIVIDSTQSGSVEYEFLEVQGLSASPFEASAVAHASTAGTAPAVSITPANSGDVVIAAIGWPSGTATIGSLPGSPWVNDATVVGVG